MNRKAYVDYAIGLLHNHKFHLVLAAFESNPSIMAAPALMREVSKMSDTFNDNWARNTSPSVRQSYRDFAIVHTEVYPDVGIFEYPDGVSLTDPIKGSGDELSCSAVVICFEGEDAESGARQIQQRFEYFMKQNKPAPVKDWLSKLGLQLKFVRVHDCQQHPLTEEC